MVQTVGGRNLHDAFIRASALDLEDLLKAMALLRIGHLQFGGVGGERSRVLMPSRTR